MSSRSDARSFRYSPVPSVEPSSTKISSQSSPAVAVTASISSISPGRASRSSRTGTTIETAGVALGVGGLLRAIELIGQPVAGRCSTALRRLPHRISGRSSA